MRLLTTLSSAAMALAVSASALWSAELIMIDQPGCHWCEKWDAEIGPIYPNTDEGKRAPLRRADIRNLPDDVTFASRPVFTPTFILVNDGQELGRIEGYPGEDFFWPMILQLLDEHPAATVPQL